MAVPPPASADIISGNVGQETSSIQVHAEASDGYVSDHNNEVKQARNKKTIHSGPVSNT
jgi:hypothetical protein